MNDSLCWKRGSEPASWSWFICWLSIWISWVIGLRQSFSFPWTNVSLWCTNGCTAISGPTGIHRPVILWIELGGKPKWLPLNSRWAWYNAHKPHQLTVHMMIVSEGGTNTPWVKKYDYERELEHTDCGGDLQTCVKTKRVRNCAVVYMVVHYPLYYFHVEGEETRRGRVLTRKGSIGYSPEHPSLISIGVHCIFSLVLTGHVPSCLVLFFCSHHVCSAAVPQKLTTCTMPTSHTDTRSPMKF